MTTDQFLTSTFTKILLVFLIALFFQAISHNFIERLVRRVLRSYQYETKLDQTKREDTVVRIFRTTFTFALWLAVGLTVLTILGINIVALLTGAGLIGVVIGLGAQNTIKDYLAGIYILTENQYRVGDIVTLSGGSTSAIGSSGVVEEITLRITKLRDLDGTLSIIRNGEASIVTNRTFKYSNVVVDLTVAYETDIDTVEQLINKTGIAMIAEDKWKSVIIEPIKFLRVDSFTEAGVVVKTIGKVRPAAQWDVAGEFRRQIKVQFDTHKVKFAVPERVVRNVEPANRKK